MTIGTIDRRSSVRGWSTNARMFMATLAAILLAFIAAAPQALAIMNGQPTGDKLFTNVGFIYVANGERLRPRCTLSLYAPIAAITAKHCVDFEGQDVWVSFASERPANPTRQELLHGVAYTADSKNYMQGDYAVVVFDAPVRRVPLMQFPSVGLLDQSVASGALQSATLTFAGYGATGFEKGSYDLDLTRRYASTTGNVYQSIQRDRLNLTQNANKVLGDPAGTNIGDSGGPAVWGGAKSLLQIGVISTGDGPGGNSNVLGRLDTVEAHEFYSRFGNVVIGTPTS